VVVIGQERGSVELVELTFCRMRWVSWEWVCGANCFGGAKGAEE